MKICTTPEDCFLEKDVDVSHGNMAHCLIDRTAAIIEALHVALDVEEVVLTNDTLIRLLWQVSGNLDELRVVVDRWPKAKN